MKLVPFTMIIVAIAALVLTAGCGKSLQERIEQAKRNAQDEQLVQKQAQQDEPSDYLDEWQAFRSDAEKQLAANTKSIDSLKLRIAAADDMIKAKVGPQIEALKKKNGELKKKLDGYRDEGKVNWDAFKRDFSHDLDGLDKALKDLTTDSK
jgi:chromosome segregation ATPase